MSLDDVTEISMRSVRGLHNAVAERLRQYQTGQAAQVERLVGSFRDVLTVLSERGTEGERAEKVKDTLDGDLDAWISAQVKLLND